MATEDGLELFLERSRVAELQAELETIKGQWRAREAEFAALETALSLEYGAPIPATASAAAQQAAFDAGRRVAKDVVRRAAAEMHFSMAAAVEAARREERAAAAVQRGVQAAAASRRSLAERAALVAAVHSAERETAQLAGNVAAQRRLQVVAEAVALVLRLSMRDCEAEFERALSAARASDQRASADADDRATAAAAMEASRQAEARRARVAAERTADAFRAKLSESERAAAAATAAAAAEADRLRASHLKLERQLCRCQAQLAAVSAEGGAATTAAAAAHESCAAELRAALHAIRGPSRVATQLGARRAAEALAASRGREARAAAEIATLQQEVGVAERRAGAEAHRGAMRMAELQAVAQYRLSREEYARSLVAAAQVEAERAREVVEAEVADRMHAARAECERRLLSMEQALRAETVRADRLAEEARELRRQLGAAGGAGSASLAAEAGGRGQGGPARLSNCPTPTTRAIAPAALGYAPGRDDLALVHHGSPGSAPLSDAERLAAQIDAACLPLRRKLELFVGGLPHA
eukprot:scaffold9692_cov96-Isochrysis_galbana.AAC.8